MVTCIEALHGAIVDSPKTISLRVKKIEWTWEYRKEEGVCV